MCRFCCLFTKFLNFVKNISFETRAPHRLSRVGKEKCHNSVIYEPISKIKTLPYFNQFEAFIIYILLLISKFLNFIKKMSSETFFEGYKKRKKVITQLFMNQFQKIKHVSSDFIN